MAARHSSSRAPLPAVARPRHRTDGPALRKAVAVAFSLLVALDMVVACSRDRSPPSKAAAHTPAAHGAGEAHAWPEHGVTVPSLAAAVAQLPGDLLVASEAAAWRLRLRERRVDSLAELAAGLGADVRLFPTTAAFGDGRSLWIATRGHEPEHLEQLALYDGKGLRLVGPVAANVRAPALTADRGRVVLESSHGSFRDLYLLDLASDELAALTANREGNFEPSLSPDGEALVFASSRDGDSELYAIALPASMPADLPAATRLTAFHRDDFSPAYGPKGRIAFVSDREGADRVFVVRGDGTDLSRPSAETSRAVTEAAPAWSSAGVLAYLRIEAGRSELRLWEPGGALGGGLTAAGQTVESFAWDPSGEWLAVVESPAKKTPQSGRARAALWAVRRDGKARVQILPVVDAAAVVRWHPAAS